LACSRRAEVSGDVYVTVKSGDVKRGADVEVLLVPQTDVVDSAWKQELVQFAIDYAPPIVAELEADARAEAIKVQKEPDEVLVRQKWADAEILERWNKELLEEQAAAYVHTREVASRLDFFVQRRKRAWDLLAKHAALRARTDVNGHFVVRGVPDGKYYLCAAYEVLESFWMVPIDVKAASSKSDLSNGNEGWAFDVAAAAARENAEKLLETRTKEKQEREEAERREKQLKREAAAKAQAEQDAAKRAAEEEDKAKRLADFQRITAEHDAEARRLGFRTYEELVEARAATDLKARHMHRAPDGFTYCDAGYQPSADKASCIAEGHRKSDADHERVLQEEKAREAQVRADDAKRKAERDARRPLPYEVSPGSWTCPDGFTIRSGKCLGKDELGGHEVDWGVPPANDY
jgi:hypothetical protein